MKWISVASCIYYSVKRTVSMTDVCLGFLTVVCPGRYPVCKSCGIWYTGSDDNGNTK